MTTSVTYPLRTKSKRAYNLNADTTSKSFMVPFSYQHSSQVAVNVDGEPFLFYTLDGTTPIVWVDSIYLKDKDELTIYRSTDVAQPVPDSSDLSQFTAGHPVKADDLNNNFALVLQSIQEKLDNLQQQIDDLNS